MALMLSGAMLLRHLGEVEAGDRVEDAVADVIAEGRSVTDDVTPSHRPGSGVSTAEATEAVVRRLTAQ
jgi:isocitrate dehydrogenase (NAD+)